MATLGPASEQPAVLDRMLSAGVDVVRLNLSHGPIEEHIERLHAVRAAAVRVGRVVGVLADLPGPKVRSGTFADEGVMLASSAELTLVAGNGACNAAEVTVDYPSLTDDVRPGDRIVLGDGAITLRAVEVSEHGVRAVVETGGRVTGRPGVHLPSERLRLTAPTEADLRLARVMAAEGADFVAVSFVRGANDMALVRQAIQPHTTRLVAKIETMPAVAALDEIIGQSDAIMVARGDLGIESPLEDVPHLQKQIIRRCVEVGMPVITATQMLESMITAPSPTRAEVSDVANAVFDGTDAVMLSGETAIGHDPVLVVRTMARITERAEAEASYHQWAERLGRRQRTDIAQDADRITMAITHAAGLAALDAGAEAILCCTRSGRTARAMARFRPTIDLLALSPDAATVRALALSWGVIPIEVDVHDSTDELVWYAVETAVQHGVVHAGQVVLVLAGAPDRPSGAATDVLRIVRVS